jgi:spore germination cell wall hydrolase CwlJ-like protein
MGERSRALSLSLEGNMNRKLLLVAVGLALAYYPLQFAEQKVRKHYTAQPSPQHIEQAVTTKIEPYKLTKQELNCLTDNVYYEAGNQPSKGMVAVAFVTLNRAKDPRFPKNVCSVVHQKAEVVPPPTEDELQPAAIEVCQFSWVCAKPDHRDPYLLKRAKQAALFAVDNFHPTMDPTHGSIHFHATYVKPTWRLIKKKTTQIGDHIFYR